MSQTSIPAVLDHLYARVAAAAEAGVQVFDGQPDTDRLKNDVVIVGWSPEQPAVTLENEPQGLANERWAETYTVQGLVSSLRGSTRMQPVREAAFALLDTVAGVVAADATCGGLVHRAVLSVGTVEAVQTPEGAACTVLYGVRVVGHTRRL